VFLVTVLLAVSASGASEAAKLKLAIKDLAATYGSRYPDAERYLERLSQLEDGQGPAAKRELVALRREALLAHPLLNARILLVRRKAKNRIKGVAIPAPHESNSGLSRKGYDNEIAVLDLRSRPARISTLYRPKDGGYVGETDLHWDAERLLFTRSDATNWKLWEVGLDGSGLRQVSHTDADVDCFDACYLPDDRIVFGCTASYQSVPCHHGCMPAGHLYRMDGDGSNMRQLCFDQDIDAHPVVLNSGQVMYSRWDYTGINHIYFRQLMVMNPDGTGQKAVYGSNTWFPNSLFFPQPLPGKRGELVSILSGYHGVPRMGWLVKLNTSVGWHGIDGITHRISGKGAPIKPVIKDNAVDADWPKFLHPYPLTDKHFLVAGLRSNKDQWAIYLGDIYDNLVQVYTDPDYALLEPVVIRSRPRPMVIPDRVDLARDDATLFMHDVYAGPGLHDVPRGTIKRLRVLSYHFGYRGLAGSDKIGYGGPWDAMRIEGTVPVEEDGSAMFTVPANTPLALQPLDEEGKAVQLMRSWLTAMPGERLSCIGCHETPADSVGVSVTAAAKSAPRTLDPWYGPARGFDFAREVQPVLDRHCVSCHNGKKAIPDLRPEDQVANRQTWPIGYPKRLTPQMFEDTGARMTYTPAYDALIHYIRRVGIEDDVSLLAPGEYHADTSPLIQMLRKGHKGVKLDGEDWDRLTTWIDLNAPCHGTWGEVYPIPGKAHERRMELRAKYGGPLIDPEKIYPAAATKKPPVKPVPLRPPKAPALDGWPLNAQQAGALQTGEGAAEIAIDLGDGISLQLRRIPAGAFVMGDTEGEPDEYPQSVQRFDQPFWMGAVEITNEQYGRFDPDHSSGYYVKRISRHDDQGLPLDGARQPVVRISWERAIAFCTWLSKKTGRTFSLPTESQWEYACRAGSASPLWFGDGDTDFSRKSNLADATFSKGVLKPRDVHPETVTQWSGGVPHLVLEGGRMSESRFRDGHSVTAGVGSFQTNVWGLRDMHGNVAEWTLSRDAAYPYAAHDGRNDATAVGRRVVRGGSFFDPPKRSRSAFRRSYHPWQRVFNVGFRVVCNDDELLTEEDGLKAHDSLAQATARQVRGGWRRDD